MTNNERNEEIAYSITVRLIDIVRWRHCFTPR